jgi:hypothetical protein
MKKDGNIGQNEKRGGSQQEEGNPEKGAGRLIGMVEFQLDLGSPGKSPLQKAYHRASLD